MNKIQNLRQIYFKQDICLNRQIVRPRCFLDNLFVYLQIKLLANFCLITCFFQLQSLYNLSLFTLFKYKLTVLQKESFKLHMRQTTLYKHEATFKTLTWSLSARRLLVPVYESWFYQNLLCWSTLQLKFYKNRHTGTYWLLTINYLNKLENDLILNWFHCEIWQKAKVRFHLDLVGLYRLFEVTFYGWQF